VRRGSVAAAGVSAEVRLGIPEVLEDLRMVNVDEALCRFKTLLKKHADAASPDGWIQVGEESLPDDEALALASNCRIEFHVGGWGLFPDRRARLARPPREWCAS
jgi:hypothetical protein